jgi:hypothetical protein
MQAENLGVPRPGLFYKVFRATHPSIGERIDFCNAYRARPRAERASRSDPGHVRWR